MMTKTGVYGKQVAHWRAAVYPRRLV